MNTEALFLFLILLLGLFLCSFLGGNCGCEGFTDNKNNINNKLSSSSGSGASTSSGNKFDNYNHYTGTSNELSSGTTFYGENGTTASVMNNTDGSQSLQIILPGNSTPIIFKQKEGYTNYSGPHINATKFYGPNGETATIINANNGEQAIKVETSNGTYYYNTSSRSIINNTETSTQYYGSTGSPIQKSQYSMAFQGDQYYGPYGGTATTLTGPAGNTAYNIEGPGGNSVSGINNYYDSLPIGIPKSQIPAGQEDLYILKSEVVPPVCPACPVSTAVVPRQESCPPCPACARCPEPSFECKKVPNYSAIDNDYLPAPVLSDFSSFGM